MLINLELVGKWTYEEIIYFVKKETNVSTRKAVSKTHRILNHKKIKKMEFTYRFAGKLETKIRKLIKEVLEGCEI